jgi:hypothetical protein
MKKPVKILIGLVVNIWLFANFAYWAFHQPQYGWIFDVNASMIGAIWATFIGGLLIWLLVEAEEL